MIHILFNILQQRFGTRWWFTNKVKTVPSVGKIEEKFWNFDGVVVVVDEVQRSLESIPFSFENKWNSWLGQIYIPGKNKEKIFIWYPSNTSSFQICIKSLARRRYTSNYEVKTGLIAWCELEKYGYTIRILKCWEYVLNELHCNAIKLENKLKFKNAVEIFMYSARKIYVHNLQNGFIMP